MTKILKTIMIGSGWVALGDLVKKEVFFVVKMSSKKDGLRFSAPWVKAIPKAAKEVLIVLSMVVTPFVMLFSYPLAVCSGAGAISLSLVGLYDEAVVALIMFLFSSIVVLVIELAEPDTCYISALWNYSTHGSCCDHEDRNEVAKIGVTWYCILVVSITVAVLLNNQLAWIPFFIATKKLFSWLRSKDQGVGAITAQSH